MARRRAFRRDSDRLEWHGWVAAALACALAVPLALVMGLLARSALAETAREQRVERVVGAPTGARGQPPRHGSRFAVRAAAAGAVGRPPPRGLPARPRMGGGLARRVDRLGRGRTLSRQDLTLPPSREVPLRSRRLSGTFGPGTAVAGAAARRARIGGSQVLEPAPLVLR